MDLALTEEQQAVRAAFATLLAKESSPDQVRATEVTGFDPQLWSSICSMGAMEVGIPSAMGGADAGLVELSLIAEEIGRRVAPVPFAEPVAAGRLCAQVHALGLVADAIAGSRLVSLAPKRRPLGEQLLVDGAIADVVLVLEGDRLVAFHRPAEVSPVPNAGGLPMACWEAADGEVVAIGAEATGAFEQACDDVRVLRAAALCGLALQAIELGADYARERLAFGVPIGSYQAVAHPLADSVTLADGVQLLVRKAAWAMDEYLEVGSVLAVEAFVAAAELARVAAGHSLHIHGGYGFMREYDIQLYYRRAMAWSVCFDDPSRQLLVLADRLFGPAA